jgi:hypothetical protein
MLSLHTFIFYSSVCAIAIATPGPGVVAIVARALGGSFRATIPAVLATTIGDLILMSLSALGLAHVALSCAVTSSRFLGHGENEPQSPMVSLRLAVRRFCKHQRPRKQGAQFSERARVSRLLPRIVKTWCRFVTG